MPVPERSRRHADLVVVGAGFAGLACARAAAARGVETLVIDRKRSAGDAVRTTGILVKEVADAWDVPRDLTRKIRGVRLYGPSLRHVDLRSPGSYFLATDTPRLMEWLAEEAEAAGASVRWETPYRGMRPLPGGYSFDRISVTARIVAACDGARSSVARDHGLGVNRRFLAGVEEELEGVRGLDGDLLHVFLDPRMARGYIGWAVPGAGGIVQAGAAARLPHRPRVDLLRARLDRLVDLSRARVTGRRAGLIPCGGPVRPFAREGLLLLGDAAGMVSPLTAGGIHPALETGRAAGVAISDFLLDGGEEPARAIRHVLPRFRIKRLLRILFDRPIPAPLLDAMLALPPLRALAQAVFYHHRGLLSRRCWRDLLRASAARTPAQTPVSPRE